MNKPAYDLKEFETTCAKQRNKVLVSRGAANSARIDFALDSKQKLIMFIGNKGLECPRFINAKPWENNPELIEIMVDAYEFYAGADFGYMAFLYSPKLQKWLIKSFKKNQQEPARNLPFLELERLK